jgi:kinetochore protein Nuf2
MLEIGFADFSFKDMTRPTHHRIIKILSSLVNYAKFREQRLTTFEQVSAVGVSTRPDCIYIRLMN